jgi:UDP-N-acetylglucosamine transferase subunit ALG13
VILVTTGSYEPFDRLLEAVDRLQLDEEIVVQHGTSSVRPRTAARNVDFLPYDDLVALVARARVVVTHAGVGSILTALANGKRPIVVPRLARHGDAVDDHQLPLAERLDESGLVTLLRDLDQLEPAIAAAGADVEPLRQGGALAADLGEFIAGALA